MREIKFRAIQVDNGEWVYGSLIVLNSGFYIVDTDYYNSIIADLHQKLKINALWEDNDFKKVNENTIGQFTGLKDKNGKEIYEGDIVKTKYIEKREFQTIKYDSEMEFIELVVFKDQAFQLEIDIEGIKLYRYLSFGKDVRVYGDIKLREIEVVGNIHNNPEF